MYVAGDYKIDGAQTCAGTVVFGTGRGSTTYLVVSHVGIAIVRGFLPVQILFASCANGRNGGRAVHVAKAPAPVVQRFYTLAAVTSVDKFVQTQGT
jgi:CO dehydrogenase/acetyl-CoA synthase alpha subunit